MGLQAGGAITNAAFNVDASLAQTGLVPTTAQSLQVKAFGGILEITFAGQAIPLIPLGTGSNYILYGGDISQFAGQTGELQFIAPALPGPNPYNGVRLDSIVFSPNPVPEPSVFGLLAVGALLLRIRRRRNFF